MGTKLRKMMNENADYCNPTVPAPKIKNTGSEREQREENLYLKALGLIQNLFPYTNQDIFSFN